MATNGNGKLGNSAVIMFFMLILAGLYATTQTSDPRENAKILRAGIIYFTIAGTAAYAFIAAKLRGIGAYPLYNPKTFITDIVIGLAVGGGFSILTLSGLTFLGIPPVPSTWLAIPLGNLVIVSFFAPITETAFRNNIAASFAEFRTTKKVAQPMASLVFTLFHYYTLGIAQAAALVTTFIYSTVDGGLTSARKNQTSSIVAHTIINTVLLAKLFGLSIGWGF